MTAAADHVAAELAGYLGGALERVSSVHIHLNEHFRSQDRFVKVFNGRREYFDAEIAASRARSAAVCSPKILATGHLHDGRPWLAYEWLTLRDVKVDPSSAFEFGALVGELHAGSEPSSALRPRPRYLEGPILELCDAVALIDPALANRLRTLVAAVPRERWASPAPEVLLHGDIGWRNIARADDGVLVLLDFEHARRGPADYEFAKLWDRELTDPVVRGEFLHGYAARTADFEPTDATLLVIRLWAAAGIFPYARRTADEDYFEHGLKIVARLEQELA